LKKLKQTLVTAHTNAAEQEDVVVLNMIFKAAEIYLTLG
jgi:hypothetical protein